MRTSLVNSAAGVIQRAMQRCETAAGVAIALDSAQMLQDPQTAAEHTDLKAKYVDAASTVAELVQKRTADLRAHNADREELDTLRARVAELEARPSRSAVLRKAADDVDCALWDNVDTTATTVQSAWLRGVNAALQMLQRMADEAGKDTAAGGESTRAEAPADVTVYRARHDAIVMGLYTTAAAARAHCETAMHREIPGIRLDWIEDEEDGVAELVAAVGEDERSTGYVVEPLTVASAYDEEADE